jgi:hypothetical protein
MKRLATACLCGVLLSGCGSTATTAVHKPKPKPRQSFGAQGCSREGSLTGRLLQDCVEVVKRQVGTGKTLTLTAP